MSISDYITAANTYRKHLTRSLGRTPAPAKECTLCFTTKPYTAFPRTNDIPKPCRNCILPSATACCKDCLKSSLAVQVQSKHPRQISCPQCPNIWNWMSVMIIFGDSDLGKQRKRHYIARLVAFDKLAQTLSLLIQQESRLCPHCARAFQRRAGCGRMRCGVCCGWFVFGETVSVEEAHKAWVEGSQGRKKEKGKANARVDGSGSDV